MNYLSSEINKSVCHSAMWETWVLSLGWEDPLEEGMATHSSILDWRSLADYSPCGHKVRHNWTTKHTHIHTHTHTRYIWLYYFKTDSVIQSCLTLCAFGLPHVRLPCPSPFPGACPNSCPLSWWWHLTISSSVAPFFTISNLCWNQFAGIFFRIFTFMLIPEFD